MLSGQFAGDGFVGGVRDIPTVAGRMPVEQSARVVRVAGAAGGAPGEWQQPGGLRTPSDPDGASGPSTLVPQHRGVRRFVGFSEFAEDVPGLGTVVAVVCRQGEHVLRRRQ